MNNKDNVPSSPLLEELFAFVAKTNHFREIERVILIKNSARRENDLEHSGQLALCALYLIERKNLPLDLGKVLTYALVHDLVELYAGDVYTFDKDMQKHAHKAMRESEALKKLQSEFPDTPMMWQAVNGYQNKSDEEAKFVYALDKLLPLFNHILHGNAWKELDVSLQALEENKREKIAHSTFVVPLFEEVMTYLSQHEKEFFNTNITDKS